MIIWRRKGWLVPIIFIVVMVIIPVVINSSFGSGYFQSNEWPKALAVALAALAIAGFGYLVNYKHREVLIDEEAGTKTKASSHTLFFIPVEFWAIIIPAFLIWVDNYSEEKNAKELSYINAPKINDLYLLDITRTEGGVEDEFKYGLFKVVGVQSDGVDVSDGRYVFSTKKAARKAIPESKTKEDYYSEDIYFIDTQALISLQNDGDIFSIRRE